MEYLVSRPGKLATPPFNKRDTLRCESMGSTSYNGGSGWELRETFPSGADIFWQTPPKNYLSGDGEPNYYWMWAPVQYSWYFGSSKLAPDVVIGGETLSVDSIPTNGHLSWGNGKFRYDVSDIRLAKDGALQSPLIGYVYEKIKASDTIPHTLASYWDSNSSKWIGDGWYYFDTTYYQLENGLTINGKPNGAVMNEPDLSSNVTATFDWPDLCYGLMGNMAPLSAGGTSRQFGIPIWVGSIRFPDPTGVRMTRMAGIPTFDQETKQFGMEFVFGINQNLNYNSNWECVHKYSTDISGNAKDMRSIYYRGNSLSTGWFEFEAPTSLSVGTQIHLTNHISPGVTGSSQDATLELSGFAPFRSATITAYTDPTESTRRTFQSGMLLGVFNVGTMIY